MRGVGVAHLLDIKFLSIAAKGQCSVQVIGRISGDNVSSKRDCFQLME